MKNILQLEVREAFAKRLERLTEETPRQWGTMNATQMLAHLNEAFRIALGMKSARDLSTWFSRNVMFPIAIYVLPKFPKNLKGPREQDIIKSNIETKDFYTELAFLLKFMEILSEREDGKFKSHPLFGALNKTEWANLFTKHIDHHFKQFGI